MSKDNQFILPNYREIPDGHEMMQITEEQYNRIKKVEAMVEKAIRSVLDRLGCPTKESDTAVDINLRMQLAGIEIRNCIFEGNPKMNGWYFNKLGQWVSVIYHPTSDVDEMGEAVIKVTAATVPVDFELPELKPVGGNA